MIDRLELLVEAAKTVPSALFVGSLIGNTVLYNTLLGMLYNSALDNGRNYAQESAKRMIGEMDKRGWFHNNVSQIGARLAYERFLEDAK
jgi:hypothetical protein